MNDTTLMFMIETRIAAAKACHNSTEEIYMRSIKKTVQEIIEQRDYYKSLIFTESGKNET